MLTMRSRERISSVRSLSGDHQGLADEGAPFRPRRRRARCRAARSPRAPRRERGSSEIQRPATCTTTRSASSSPCERLCVTRTTVAPPVPQLLEDGAQHPRRMGIEPGIGLVEEDQLRLVEESPREGEPLLHAAGEALHQVVAPIPEAHLAEPRRDPLLQRLQPVEAAVEPEVLGGAQTGVEIALMGEDADAAAPAVLRVGDRLAGDEDLAAGGAERPASMRRSVVLPAPFGPKRVRNCPAASENPTPRTAGWGPYHFSSPRASMTGAAMGVSSGRGRPQASRAPHPEQKRLPGGFAKPQEWVPAPAVRAGAVPPPRTVSTASMASSASRSSRPRSIW